MENMEKLVASAIASLEIFKADRCMNAKEEEQVDAEIETVNKLADAYPKLVLALKNIRHMNSERHQDEADAILRELGEL